MVMALEMTMVMIAMMMTGRFEKVCCAGPLFPDFFRHKPQQTFRFADYEQGVFFLGAGALIKGLRKVWVRKQDSQRKESELTVRQSTLFQSRSPKPRVLSPKPPRT